MSTPAAPPPRDDRTVVAVAWAVAAAVIAISATLIAWLALSGSDGGEDTAAPAASESPAVTEDPTGEDDASGTGGADPAGQAEDPGAAAQTPSPEVAEMMLGLQRRDAGDAMAEGAVDAPVVMIEYADYRCPYCAQFALEIRPELQPLVDDGTLRIEFRDLVLFEETSELAAVAGRAAAAQGHLSDFQREVFALSTQGHGEYGEADLISIAEEVGVPDLQQFEADLSSEDLLSAVRADTEEARSLGVSSTPTFLVNTQVLQGLYPAETVIEVIEREAAAAQD